MADRDHKNMTLEQIMSCKDGFDLLADHLVREFCIENLLFLYEMAQIKHQLITAELNVFRLKFCIFMY